MKAAGLYLALGAAHLVACAPALSVSSELLRDTPEAVPRTPYDDVESAGGVRASRDPLSVLSKHRVPPAGSAVDDPALIPGLDDESMRQTRPGMPCPHAQAATDRNDVLVVYLGAIFLLLVIVMEGGKSIFARWVPVFIFILVKRHLTLATPQARSNPVGGQAGFALHFGSCNHIAQREAGR